MSKTKYTAADIWLHSEYIYKRKWKCACMCVCFVHSYLRTFAARGRENCRTPAAFGITATLPPAGRQQVQPKFALFFSCHFSPLTADIPSFSLPPLYSFLLCSERRVKKTSFRQLLPTSPLQYIRLLWFRLLQTESARCASGSNLAIISFDTRAGNNETDKEGWGWRKGMMSLERKLGY